MEVFERYQVSQLLVASKHSLGKEAQLLIQVVYHVQYCYSQSLSTHKTK